MAGVLPYLLFGWSINQPLLGLFDTKFIGICTILIGLVCLFDCFGRFAIEGRGTPAPLAETQILVASGLYRFVRNPMYIAVITIVLGEGLLFGNSLLLLYATTLWIVFHLFIWLYEEPHLFRRFGDSYKDYCANVRRWLPSLKPWNPSDHQID